MSIAARLVRVRRAFGRPACLVMLTAATVLPMSGCGGAGDPAADGGRRHTLAASDGDEVGALLDWAERSYPEHFPTAEPTRVAVPYVYRYYPGTGNYVGVADGIVSVLGPISGGQILQVGTVEQFRCRFRPRACTDSAVERVQHGFGLDSAGRLIAVDGPTLSNFVETSALPGSRLRLVATNVRQFTGSPFMGMFVDSQGRVSAWGSPNLGWMGGMWSLLTNEIIKRPRAMPWPGPVRQVAFNGLTAVALLEDGSLWDMPLAREAGLSPVNVVPRQFTGAPTLAALSKGSGGLHAITAHGSVLALDFETLRTRPVDGASDVHSLSCGESHCMAIRADGTVLAWGAGPLGDGSERASSSARPVPSLSSIVQVAVTNSQSIALDADGRVWAWGWGGSSGSRTRIPRLLPRHAENLGTVIDVVCGSSCFVRKADGSVWNWSVGDAVAAFPAPTAVPDFQFL